MGRYISSERRLIPEHTLRLVNQEASRFVGPPRYGLKRFMRTGRARMRGAPPITVSFGRDMFFLIDSSPMDFHHIFRAPPQLDVASFAAKSGYIDRLRHLALRVFDIAIWQPNWTPADLWLKPGVISLLSSMPKLETLHLVVDRVFSSSPSSSTKHRARKGRGPHLLSSKCSELQDLVASLPRDKFGFSDYDAFATATKCDITFPASCRPSPNVWAGLDMPFVNIYSVQFESYDQFFQVILNAVRAHTSPPLLLNGNSPTVRLVVDLDSNLNGRKVRQETASGADPSNKKIKDLSEGYDRYFARSSSALGWYTDVSRYEWTDRLGPGAVDEDEDDEDEGDLDYKPEDDPEEASEDDLEYDSGDDGKNVLDDLSSDELP